MAIANQTQLTTLCFAYDRAALCAPSLVGELSVMLRDLPHTLLGFTTLLLTRQSAEWWVGALTLLVSRCRFKVEAQRSLTQLVALSD